MVPSAAMKASCNDMSLCARSTRVVSDTSLGSVALFLGGKSSCIKRRLTEVILLGSTIVEASWAASQRKTNVDAFRVMKYTSRDGCWANFGTPCV